MDSYKPAGVLLALAGSLAIGCQSTDRPAAESTSARVTPIVHYLEIVSPDADALVTLYQRTFQLSFAAPDADFGGACVATQPDGSLVGIRKPLAAHEQPIARTYRAVDDIDLAVKTAEQSGATIAYPPTRQGQRGMFAIVILGGVEQGLWQR